MMSMIKTRKTITNLLSAVLICFFLVARPVLPNAIGQTDIIAKFTIAADTTENKTLEVIPEKAENNKRIEKESSTRIAYNFIFYVLYLYFKTVNSYPSR
jgi:hypothetical protein